MTKEEIEKRLASCGLTAEEFEEYFHNKVLELTADMPEEVKKLIEGAGRQYIECLF